MSDADPGLDPNCPKCPRKLRYITSVTTGGGAYRSGDSFNVKVDSHVYECPEHGGWRLAPNGRFYPHPIPK